MSSLVPRVYRSRTRANGMYMQNFSLGRRLIFANFAVNRFVAIRKGFFAKFGGVASLAPQKRAFLRKNRIFHQLARKFSHTKISTVRYSLVFHSSRHGSSQEFPSLVHSIRTSSAPALEMHSAQALEMLAQMECPRSVQVLQEVLCIQECVQECVT